VSDIFLWIWSWEMSEKESGCSHSKIAASSEV
jgi:hypothetical protein